MDQEARRQALNEIRENITRFGYHLYAVTGDQTPRYAYTIGLTPKFGFELIFGGGILFMYKEVGKIIAGIIEQLTAKSASHAAACVVGHYGTFSFRKCDPSWTEMLMLGAIDYYQRPDVSGLQIVPDDEHRTLDVPDMSIAWSPLSAPVWQWLREPWMYSVPRSSHVVTDLSALRGIPVTEACRWEDDYWELFAGEGPGVPDEETRVVGLGTMLAIDTSLTSVIDLKVGHGIWRENDSEWSVWQSPEATDEPTA
jgi:hypothetical protein